MTHVFRPTRGVHVKRTKTKTQKDLHTIFTATVNSEYRATPPTTIIFVFLVFIAKRVSGLFYIHLIQTPQIDFCSFSKQIIPVDVSVRPGAVAGNRDLHHHSSGRIVQQPGHVLALPFVREDGAYVSCNTDGKGQGHCVCAPPWSGTTARAT